MEEGRKKEIPALNKVLKYSYHTIPSTISWSFLYDLKLPVSMSELDQSCINLQNVLTHNSMSDISGADLAEEIISLRQFLDIDQGHPY